MENVSTEARRDLRVGEQLHEAENATWQWWKEVYSLSYKITLHSQTHANYRNSSRLQVVIGS